MAGRGTINYPSHMGNEDTANSRSLETQILIKSYTLHFLTMFLALWVTHFLCAYKVVCCSCSQSQQARIFFSFHMIWLKISGNLDVSFGVFHWLRTEELQTREAPPLARGVSAGAERREPRIPPYPPGSNDPVAAVNSHWVGRKQGTWRCSSAPGSASDGSLGVPWARCCMVWGLAEVLWSICPRSLSREPNNTGCPGQAQPGSLRRMC